MGIRHELSSTSFWILILQSLLIASLGAYVYFFGIPASFKRYLQDEAIENFGESKAKEYLKQGLDKVPASDNPEVQKARKQAQDKVSGSLGSLGDSIPKLGGSK